MPKPKVFISHTHDEASLAQLINTKLIEPHLLEALDVFVSSDAELNPGGASWLNNIEDALLNAVVILIVASPRSITRPWINIEGGAAWLRYLQARRNPTLPPVFVMPLCHSGLTPGKLPLPWGTFNAVEVRTLGGLQQILETLARAADIRAPRPDLAGLALEVQDLEKRFTVYTDIEARLAELINHLGPTFRTLLTQPNGGAGCQIRTLPLSVTQACEGPLRWLKAQGHVEYLFDRMTFSGGGPSGTTQTQDLHFRCSDNFLTQVLPHLTLP